MSQKKEVSQMANKNLPKSFNAMDEQRFMKNDFPVAASYAGEHGDVGCCDSAGRVETSATSQIVLGLQSGLPKDVSKGGNADVDTPGGETCSAGDLIAVYFEPGLIFTGQITTGALTDKYTTQSGAACFDLAGDNGVQYIDAGATSYNIFKIIGPWKESNGSESAVGAYQKVIACFNSLVHALGSTA